MYKMPQISNVSVIVNRLELKDICKIRNQNDDISYSHSTEEEISNMRKELEKYGIQMPTFSKIGGILANELSVDEAACE